MLLFYNVLDRNYPNRGRNAPVKPLWGGLTSFRKRGEYHYTTSGSDGGRVILYAGQPQKDPIVSYGPFNADTNEEYHHWEMNHITAVGEEQKMVW